MSYTTTAATLVFGTTFLLAACEQAPPPTAVDAAVFSTGAPPHGASQRCFNVRTQDDGVLGFYVIGWGGETYMGIGVSTDVTLGEFEGTATSVVIDPPLHDPTYQPGPGALHVVEMYHVYDLGEDGSFFTEDRAVCGPQVPCRVNTKMEIADGSGAFEGATGRLHNHGWLNVAEGTAEINIHGRICLAE